MLSFFTPYTPPSPGSPISLETKIVTGLAVLLLALRFLFPGDALYVSDEANFQLHLNAYLANGWIPFTNFRGGSLSVPYGSGPIYFYALVRLFSDSPIFIATIHTFACTIGAFFFWRALDMLFGKKIAAWGLLLMAASPLLFFFSRHNWDNSLFQTLSAILFYLVVKIQGQNNKSNAWLYGVFGLVTGFSVIVHLMVGPFAVACGLFLLLSLYLDFSSPKQKLLCLLAFTLGCAIWVVPYAVEAIQVIQAEAPLANSKFQSRWGDGRNLWWTFMRTLMYPSLWGSTIQWIGSKDALAEFAGPSLYFFFKKDLWGWLIKFSVAALLVYFFKGLSLKKMRSERAFLFLVLAFFCHILIINYLNIPTDPHYYMPVWWIPMVAAAWALTKLKGPFALFLKTTMALTVLVNVLYIATTLTFVHKNEGIRNRNYGTTISSQAKTIAALCEDLRQKNRVKVSLDVSNIPMDPYPFRYHFFYLKECEGISAVVEKNPGQECALQYESPASTSARMSYRCLF